MVVGAGGFIGAAVADAFRKSGIPAALLLRKDTSPWRLAADGERKGYEQRVFNADLTDLDSLRKVLSSVRPQVVVNCAETPIHPAVTPQQRIAAWRDSTMGIVTLLQALAESDVHHLINFGSSLAYESSNEPLTECSPERPTSFRGSYKLAASIASRQWAAEHARVLTELRPFSVYGSRQQPERLIPSVMRSLRDGTPFSLTAESPRHDFVFVEDVAQACVAVTQSAKPPVLLNLGSGVETTNRELVAVLERVSGRSITLSTTLFPARPSDTEHWVADTAAARSAICWNPVSLERGLATTWDWFRS